MLGGAPKCLLGQLSGILRAAARLILLLPRSDSVTDRIRIELHWLDIPSRVTFKLCVLAYRCIHGSAPSHLARFFTPVSAIAGRSQLRSASAGVLFVPRSYTSTIGPRAFAQCHFLPLCLEQPPVDLRDPGLCLLSFRKNWRLICSMCLSEASFRGLGSRRPQGKRKKEKKKEKKRKKEKKEKKKEGNYELTSNYYIWSVVFSNFSIVIVALNNKKMFAPQEKVEMTPLVSVN